MRRILTPSLLLLLAGCASRGAAPAVPAAPASQQVPDAQGQPAPNASPEAATEATPEQHASGDGSQAPMHEGHEAEEGDEEVDDDEASVSPPPPVPRIDLTDEQIAEQARRDPSSLGSLSLGQPARGRLFNGVQMPTDPRWRLVDPAHAWGTRETVDFISKAIARVNERFPGTDALPIGHISARFGGPLSPHKSHQAGRDVDLGYYMKGEQRWFAVGNANNLDLPRNWALIKSFVHDTSVDMIFVDTQIQRLLSAHAAAAGEDAGFLDEVFQVRGKSRAPKVRHVRGHATHIHVRFHSPMAEEMGRRAGRHVHLPALPTQVASRKGGHDARGAQASSSQPPSPAMGIVMHRARNGDVLVNLAKHYGTTVEAIQQANNLRGKDLKIGHTYRIPVPQQAKAPPGGRKGS